MKKNIFIVTLLCLFLFASSNKMAHATVSFSANTGSLGNIIEATSTNNEFGGTQGEVIFYGTDTWDPVKQYREEKAYILSWTPGKVTYQIPIRVPINRADGQKHFKIIKADRSVVVESTYQLRSFLSLSPIPPSRIVINPDQGLGVCHAVEAIYYNRGEISWQYPPAGSVPWRLIQPDDRNEDYFDWTILDNMVRLARDSGKKIWIQVGTTEGAIPDWAAYNDINGSRNPYSNPNIKVPVAGTRCASRDVKDACNNPSQRHMACDASCSVDGKIHAKGTPIPWDPEYQRLLRKLIHNMAQRYDRNPNVEAVLTMAGGCYGELSICEYNQPAVFDQWINAGYTNERYLNAAKQIIDIYLEQSHTWPDESITHGFLKTPIAEQLGMGLYDTGSIFVSGSIAQYADEKYGLRVWLKQNGLDAFTSEHGDYYWYYQSHVGNTRVGYERGKWDAVYGNCPQLDNNYKAALNDTSSFTCGSPDDLSPTRNGGCTGYMLFAQFAGTHLNLRNPRFTKDDDDRFTFAGDWTNLGNFPLIGQKRMGIKDVAVSYKLAFYFLDQETGAVKGRISVEPSIPTTYWFGYKTTGVAPNPINQGPNTFSTSNIFDATLSIPNGTYNVKLAIEDEGRQNLKFRLTDLGGLTEDSEKRYNLGTFTITKSSAPTPTPTSGENPPDDGGTPTPTPTTACTQRTSGFTTSDFTIWKNEFLNPTPPLHADYNCSGQINLSDFEIWRSNFH